MAESVNIRPVDGRRVIMSDGTLLPADGGPYPSDMFMRRLVRMGDVEIFDPAATAASPTVAKTTASKAAASSTASGAAIPTTGAGA